jgi:hypothetical protein
MLIYLLKIIFSKVIGIDQIPEEKREVYWTALEAYSIKLAEAMSKGAVEGATKNVS